MAQRNVITCDGCKGDIQPKKGFQLTEASLVGVKGSSIKTGDYCIFCLAQMCGERLMTPEIQHQVEVWDEQKWREINEERSRNHDW